MDLRKTPCICPPSPELEERIIRSKQRILGGNNLPAMGTTDLLDFRSYTLIASRPKRTRPDTFVAPAREAASVTGNRSAIVLLVDFSDCAATRRQTDINDMLFSSGTYPSGSMRDFYREVSYGKLDVTGQVSGAGGGWYRAPHPKTYYTGGNYGFGNYPQNAQKLVEDVVGLAAPFIDFSRYDGDGDSVVEALIVIAAGSGAERTGNVNDLWSHKWDMPAKTLNGVTVQNYFLAPEDGQVGVMSHEFGHLLCRWPDLYDTDYSSRGTGQWDLMASGSWNGNGDRPAHPTAWCKVKAGWLTPVLIYNVKKDVTIAPYATHEQVYKLPIGSINSKEYFLLTNRRKTGFDDHLPGEGLIIEHVDDSINSNTDENHYLVDIEQGDGARHLNTNANSGDGEDPFPSGANNGFTAASTPGSNAYNGSSSNISVTGIQRSGENIAATVKFGTVEPEKPKGCFISRFFKGIFS